MRTLPMSKLVLWALLPAGFYLCSQVAPSSLPPGSLPLDEKPRKTTATTLDPPHLATDCSKNPSTMPLVPSNNSGKTQFQALGTGATPPCLVIGGQDGSWPPGESDLALYLYGKFIDKHNGKLLPPDVVISDPSVAYITFDKKDREGKAINAELGTVGTFSYDSDAQRLKWQIAHIPDKKDGGAAFQKGVPCKVWACPPGYTGQFQLLGTWTFQDGPDGRERLTTDGVKLGQSQAYVRIAREVPKEQTRDLVNPPPVLFGPTGTKPPNLAQTYPGRAPRVHSWGSAMLWADNRPGEGTWYQEANTWHATQGPIWADPLIAFYSSQEPDEDQRYFSKAGLTQSKDPKVNWNRFSLFGAGFHLSMATPMSTVGVIYGNTTGDGSYNYGARAKRKTTDADDPTTEVNIGVDQSGTWRETVVIFPSTNEKPWRPAYLPKNPVTEAEGDIDLVFSMQDDGDPSRLLRMAVAQGSPFAQFTSTKNHRVTVGLAYCPGYGPTADCGGAEGATGPVIGTPFDVPVGSGKVRVQIVAQQVNQMDSGTMLFPGTASSNWVSFAIMWDASKGPDQLKQDLNTTPNSKDKLTYLSLPSEPDGDTYLVLAGLPSQMKNNVATMVPFDMEAAKPWAEKLAACAFNYYHGASRVSFWVGSTRSGEKRDPREVNVHFTPGLVSHGPAELNQTVFLLQPHQYATGFKDGRPAGSRPVNLNGASFLAFGTTDHPQERNKYWIARGKLEALAGTELSLTYMMPSMLPAFDAAIFQGLAVKGSAEGRGILANQSVSLNDLAFWLSVGGSYELCVKDNGPAGTAMGNGTMNDGYGAGQGIYYTAKLLNMLTKLQEPASLLANPPKQPDWFRGEIRRKPDMVRQLGEEIQEAFALYFGAKGGPAVSQTEGSTIWKSFTYAYLDPASKHLILYPAGAGGAYQPNLIGSSTKVCDGFGTASKLSDANYTWGYFVTAAALYAAVLQNPDNQGDFKTSSIDPDWWKQDRWGPAVDLMIKDLANFDRASGTDIPWWVDDSTFTTPRMDYMDLWTGISWANAFHPSDFESKQNNAAQESQMSWAGTYLWGMVTGRKPLADLGAFLYTLGAYANEAYFLGTLGQLVPENASTAPWAADHSADGTFLVRATTNYRGAKACWNTTSDQTLIHKNRGVSAWQTQPYTGKATTAGVSPFLTAGVYSGRQWYQGEDGVPPLHCLFNVLLPLEPMTLAAVRDAEYLRVLSDTTMDGSLRPWQNIGYQGTMNKALAAAGSNRSVSVKRRDPHATPVVPQLRDETVDPGCKDSVPPPFGNPCGALTTLNTERSFRDSWTWYLDQITGGNSPVSAPLNPWMQLSIPGWDCTKPDATYGATSGNRDNAFAVFSRPADVAPALLDFWTYKLLGTPVFDVTCAATDTENLAPPLPPLYVVFRNADGKASTMIYNPNAVPIKVTFECANPTGTWKTVPPPGLVRPKSMTTLPLKNGDNDK